MADSHNLAEPHPGASSDCGLSEIDPDNFVVNTNALARFLGVSARTVQNLESSGAIRKLAPNQWNLRDCVIAHNKHTNAVTANRFKEGDSDDELTLEMRQEKLKRARAEAKIATFKAGNLEGELHHRDAVARIMDDMNVALRQRALAIPSNIARMLVGQSDMPTIVGILEKAIHDLLLESKEYNLEDFLQRNPDLAGSLFEFDLDLANDSPAEGEAK